MAGNGREGDIFTNLMMRVINGGVTGYKMTYFFHPRVVVKPGGGKFVPCTI
jgi:hypothetical protein